MSWWNGCNQIATSALQGQETTTMMIYVLATAMTVAMLIATAFALHQETQRLRHQEQKVKVRSKPFGPH